MTKTILETIRDFNYQSPLIVGKEHQHLLKKSIVTLIANEKPRIYIDKNTTNLDEENKLLIGKTVTFGLPKKHK